MEIEKGAKQLPIRLSKDKFADHIVVITGAADGIGQKTAEMFAAQGASVVLVDIQEDKLKAVDSSIKAVGGKSAYQICNITDENSVATAIEQIISSHSRIDVLAHLAGVYPFHCLSGYPTEMYRRVMSINMDGTFFLVRAVLPHMQSQGYGRIVLTSSSTFQEPEMGMTAYVASKAGVVGLMRAAAIEAGPGVTINTVMPGLVKTRTAWDPTVQSDGSNPLFDHVISKQIVKRCGLPEDVAHSICFLASPEASFITGQILDLSGGATFH